MSDFLDEPVHFLCFYPPGDEPFLLGDPAVTLLTLLELMGDTAVTLDFFGELSEIFDTAVTFQVALLSFIFFFYGFL